MNSISSPVARAEDGLVLPIGASIVTRIVVAIRALKVLEKKPDDGIAAPLFNAAIDTAAFTRLCGELAQTQQGRDLLSERPTLQAHTIDLVALAKLPKGTLGHAFAQYFADNGIQPFTSPYEVRNEVDYLVKWYRETHDLHHVVTGYRTDAIGEMEFQAFAAGNLGLRTSLLILAFAAVLMPHGLPPMWRYLHKLKAAYRRGKHARPLVQERYEKLMEATVESVRASLQLPPLEER